LLPARLIRPCCRHITLIFTVAAIVFATMLGCCYLPPPRRHARHFPRRQHLIEMLFHRSLAIEVLR